jgi:GT2 family glycosyltransferase
MTSSPAGFAPRTSVVVPTYNRACLLDRLLCALGQCHEPDGGFEVIVVDDGSTDDTGAVVRNAGLANIQYLRQGNAGAAAARNRGWQSARGEIVAFTDDDCVPSPEWLVELTQAFDDRRPVAVGGAIVPLVPGFLAQFVQAERLVGHGGDASSVGYLVTANAAFSREVLARVGGFDERFPGAAGEDTDLTYRLLARDLPVTVIDGAVVAHDHRSSLRQLLRTYNKHGHGRWQLAQNHPNRGLAERMVPMMSPRYWAERYDYYRRFGVSPSAAIIYCGLRAAGLVSYAAGLARAAVSARLAPGAGKERE